MTNILAANAEHGEHAAEAGAHGGPGAIMQHLLEHIYDHTVIELPWKPFGIDISITKLTLMEWVAAGLVIVIFGTLASRLSKQQRRGRFLNFWEPWVLYVRDEMVYPIMGPETGRKYIPLFLTQFFFIFFCNMLGLIPGLATATGNLAVCGTLAIITMLTIFFMGMIEQGPITFWKHQVPSGMPWPIIPLLWPIEVIGIFIKSFALTIRLFANMVAGHIVILAFLGMIFIFHSYFVALPSVAFALFIYVLEILVALLQAFIFTLLSIIFINMAIQPEH